MQLKRLFFNKLINTVMNKFLLQKTFLFSIGTFLKKYLHLFYLEGCH